MTRSPLVPAAAPPCIDGAAVTILSECSASMSPIIRVGDQLTVARTPARPPAGAVVAYFDGRRVVAHRLLAWTDTGLRLKADAVRDADPMVPAPAYCGEVVALRRADGRTLDLTSSRWRRAGRLVAAAGALPGRRTLRWLATRTVCHVAARCLP